MFLFMARNLTHSPPSLFGNILQGKLQGGWLGSSHRLLDELISMCPALGISMRPLKGAGVMRRGLDVTSSRGGGFDLSAAVSHH